MTLPDRPSCDRCQPAADLVEMFYSTASPELQNSKGLLNIYELIDTYKCEGRFMCLPLANLIAKARSQLNPGELE